MIPPRVALITFGDARAHEWEHLFRGLTEPRHREAMAHFQKLPVELLASQDVARLKGEIDGQVDRFKREGAEALVAHVPCWTSPNLVVRGVQRMDLPTVLLSNKSPATHGTVGLLGAGGALDQIGYPHLRVREDFSGPGGDAIAEKVLPYVRAASTVARLRGKMFGLFGGRSLGIDTGTFDPMQWRRQFGVDVHHIDQLEIIRRADKVSDQAAEEMTSWLEASVGRVAYDGEALTREKLAYQSRCYVATKEIIDDMGLDFVAIKCMPDLTNHYIPQCLTAALLPGPFDFEGEKEPTVMACEADGDAALTMEILKSVSGGKPVLFGDVSYIDAETQTFYIPNCGGMCAWYAGRSSDAAENLSQIELRPSMRPSGGAITYLTASPGPMTLARLYRRAGEYRMAILSGEATEISAEAYQAFVEARGKHQLPTAFIRVLVDVDAFISEFASNHITGVAGSYTAELEQVCHMLDIEPVVMTE